MLDPRDVLNRINLKLFQLGRVKEREGYRILGIALDFDKNKINGPRSF